MAFLKMAASILAPLIGVTDPAFECQGAESKIEINNCISDATFRVELAMDITLRFALESAAKQDALIGQNVAKPALDAAQTAWAAYQIAHCSAVQATYTNPNSDIAFQNCYITLTRSRIEELTANVQRHPK